MTEVLVPLRATGGRPPLYCVHSASGSASSYLPLAPLLPADQPLYGLQAPGFDDPADQPLRTVAELSERYLAAIEADRPAEPICLLGWSFGGLVAYDLALRLAEAGRPARQLIVVDTPVPPAGPQPGEALIRRRFLADLTGADLTPAEPFDEQRALAQRYAVFHANLAALHSYQPVGRYFGRMLAVWAAGSITSIPAVQADWSRLAPGVRSQWLPGNHHSIWQDGLPALADIIARSLQPELAAH